MTNAQQILNQKYPNKEITKELDLSNQELDGSLIIQDFPNLEVIRCGNNKDLSSISLINLSKLRCFHANGCQVTNLKINECPNINNFNVANNLLTNTDFLNNLNPEKLTNLSIHSNNFTKQDLTVFSNFVNLKSLFIDNNDQKKFDLGIYNRFTGSLEPLRKLNNLEYLNIANTDINSGLEFLPKEFKKICLVNTWERKNSGHLKLKWELERSVRFPEVVEELQQEEINEPSFVKKWYLLKSWKQAKQIHSEEAFKRYNAQTWLDSNYPPHTNLKHYNEIILSDKNLIGELDLSDFTNLEKLDCSYNQLTKLNLNNCSNLIEINCANNEFTDFDFLSAIPNKEKIERLDLSDQKLEKEQTLNFLAPFIGLRKLNIANCSFFGSLKPLENLKDLREINISNTDIDSGLYYLPDNCWILRCDPNTKKKSIKITNLLVKYFEPGEKYYNLVKWREELRNNIILSIPTERLFVIRGNLKQFINKWNKQEEQELSELIALRSPRELNTLRRYIYGIQFFGRGSAVAGATLTFSDQSAIGGGLLGIYPLTELAVSKLEEKLKNEESKWREFLNDADNLLDNYNELMGLIEQIGTSIRLGEVGVELDNLKIKVDNFLESYDENKDGEININELIKKRKDLAEDIKRDNNNQGRLWGIINSIKKLEQEIDRYRKLSYYGVDEEIKGISSQDQELDIRASIDSTDSAVVNNLGINETINHEQQNSEAIELQQLIVEKQ